MKNNALILWLLVAVVTFGSGVAFGQILGGKRVGDLAPRHFAKAAVLNPDSALPAGVYTVGQAGSFPTIDSAFNTLNRDGVLGPVTLTLIDTLYEALHGRRFELGPIAGAGPASRVTIRPAVGTHVTIRGDSDAVFYFQDVKYLTLDGRSNPPSTSAGIFVHALNNPSTAWNDCIDVWGDADCNQFLYLVLRSDDPGLAAGSFGSGLGLLNLGVDTPDSNLIEGNLASATAAIWLSGVVVAPYVRPQGNVIRGNTIGEASDLLGSWGITCEFAAGTIIEGNRVQFLRRAMLPRYTFGINSLGSLNTVIRNNVVHSLYGAFGNGVGGIAGTGSATYNGQGLQIYNNMVYDLQNTSTTGNGFAGGIELWWNSNALIAYNTVLMSGTGANPYGTDALGLDVEVYNATLRNNILVNSYHQTAGGPSTALWVDVNATVTSDNNDLYVPSDPLSYTGYRGIGYHTLSDWQGAGYDLHSVSVMPPFVSPEDLHLTYTMTPVADAATPLAGITEDIDGNVRPHLGHDAPDIGADEFDHPPDAVDEEIRGMPRSYALGQNYPNPFNPTTTIEFRIQNSQLTILKVFDVLGREVATLVNEVKQPGTYTVRWDASGVASGVYLYRLVVGEHQAVRKLMLLR